MLDGAGIANEVCGDCAMTRRGRVVDDVGAMNTAPARNGEATRSRFTQEVSEVRVNKKAWIEQKCSGTESPYQSLKQNTCSASSDDRRPAKGVVRPS